MTVKNDILTVYANHLLLHFGADAMAMFYKLPDFDVMPCTNGGFRIIPSTTDDGQLVMLSKAMEIFAVQDGSTLFMNEQVFEPSAVSMVA